MKFRIKKVNATGKNINIEEYPYWLYLHIPATTLVRKSNSVIAILDDFCGADAILINDTKIYKNTKKRSATFVVRTRIKVSLQELKERIVERSI